MDNETLSDSFTPEQLGLNVSKKSSSNQPSAPTPSQNGLTSEELGLTSVRPDLRPAYDVPKSALAATERLPIGVVLSLIHISEPTRPY